MKAIILFLTIVMRSQVCPAESPPRFDVQPEDCRVVKVIWQKQTDQVTLEMTLTPARSRELESFTSTHLGRLVTISVMGLDVYTATVMNSVTRLELPVESDATAIALAKVLAEDPSAIRQPAGSQDRQSGGTAMADL